MSFISNCIDYVIGIDYATCFFVFAALIVGSIYLYRNNTKSDIVYEISVYNTYFNNNSNLQYFYKKCKNLTVHAHDKKTPYTKLIGTVKKSMQILQKEIKDLYDEEQSPEKEKIIKDKNICIKYLTNLLIEINSELNIEKTVKSAIPKNVVKKLHPILQQILDGKRASKKFSESKWVKKAVAAVLDYMKKSNRSSACINISGGVDSSVVLAVLAKAMSEAPADHPFNVNNGGKICAAKQCIHSTPEIVNRANLVVNDLRKEYGDLIKIVVHDLDLSDEYDSLLEKLGKEDGELSTWAKSMYKSYLRTPQIFALATSNTGIVFGTGNRDEDGYLYYYCKFGDGAVDVSFLWDLHKSQVFSVGKYLNVNDAVLKAPPSADLADGQTDEEEIGATYDMVELVWSYYYVFTESDRISFEKYVKSVSMDAWNQFIEEKARIDEIHSKGSHKEDINPKLIGIELESESTIDFTHLFPVLSDVSNIIGIQMSNLSTVKESLTELIPISFSGIMLSTSSM